MQVYALQIQLVETIDSMLSIHSIYTYHECNVYTACGYICIEVLKTRLITTGVHYMIYLSDHI